MASRHPRGLTPSRYATYCFLSLVSVVFYQTEPIPSQDDYLKHLAVWGVTTALIGHAIHCAIKYIQYANVDVEPAGVSSEMAPGYNIHRFIKRLRPALWAPC